MVMSDSPITKTDLEINHLEDEWAKLEIMAQRANQQFMLAFYGLILGALLLFSNVDFFARCLGLVLGTAGALAAVTQWIKKRNLQKEIERMNEQIKRRRQTTA